MTNRSSVRPTVDRLELLDALRGFALFGILLVNVRVWSGWAGAMPEEHRHLLANPDTVFWYGFLNTVLLEGKFYAIFAFLFGVGFALHMCRLGTPGLSIHRKRLTALLVIGALHMILLWAGDILGLYALLGFALPLAWRLADRPLLIAATVLLALPIGGVWLFLAAGIDPDLRFFELGRRVFLFLGGNYENAWQWRERTDWASLAAWNLAGPWFRIGELIKDWRAPTVLGTMLLGLWTGRNRNRLLGDRKFLRDVAKWGTAFGLPASLLLGTIGGLVQTESGARVLAMSAYTIGTVPLGLAYAAMFAILSETYRWVPSFFTAPGRVALTNYIGQSLIGVAVFYGVGFGLINKVSPGQFLAIAVGIFALQVAWSRLWLKWFNQGPIEYLWRRHAYVSG